MAGNATGIILQLTSFGESHGPMIGGVLDGFPSGFMLDINQVQEKLNKRAPGNQPFSSPRKEPDLIEIVSGVFNQQTTGAPIAFFIRNIAPQSADYDHLKDVYRPSHAGFACQKKYGCQDYRGGGRSSARETSVRVAAGAMCEQLLARYNISIKGYVSQIGTVTVPSSYRELDMNKTDQSTVRCPDPVAEASMLALLKQVKADGDSTGGIVTCVIRGVPAGLGEPVFNKLQADLGAAMLSINAVKGFDYGEGFAAAAMTGSRHNDAYTFINQDIHPETNHAGGILGGISTGEDIFFRVAFKPVPSISKIQHTVDKSGHKIELNIGGHHDVCFVPRAVPVVEAMAALVISDHMLLAGLIRNNQIKPL